MTREKGLDILQKEAAESRLEPKVVECLMDFDPTEPSEGSRQPAQVLLTRLSRCLKITVIKPAA